MRAVFAGILACLATATLAADEPEMSVADQIMLAQIGPEPGTAAALGLIFPGAGHMYAGDTGGAVFYMTLEAGLLAGALYALQEVEPDPVVNAFLRALTGFDVEPERRSQRLGIAALAVLGVAHIMGPIGAAKAAERERARQRRRVTARMTSIRVDRSGALVAQLRF